MASLSAEVSENHPQVRARLAEIFASWCGRIEELLRKAGNRLPPSLDRTSLAQLVVCTMEGAVLGTRLNRSLVPFDAAIAQLRTYFDLLGDRVGGNGRGAGRETVSCHVSTNRGLEKLVSGDERHNGDPPITEDEIRRLVSVVVDEAMAVKGTDNPRTLKLSRSAPTTAATSSSNW